MASNVISGMCRCCASEGTFKDMTTAYHWMGEEEVYDIMLRECFDISLTQADCDASDRGICEVCITQLRNASNFKKQVLLTEEQFKLRLENKLFKDEIVKIEPSKDEEYDSDDQNDVELEVEFAEVDYTGVVKDEEPEAPRTRKRAAKASTSRAKRSKADGETSKRLRKRTDKEDDRIKLKKNLNFSSFITIKPTIEKRKRNNNAHRITELNWQIENAKIVVKCSNATPIRAYVGSRFACSYCLDQFTDPITLRQHTKTHSAKEKPEFIEIRSLSKFIVYLDITDLNCKLCSQDFDDLKRFMQHLKDEHKQPVHNEINQHIVSFKFNDVDEYKCAICAEDFEDFQSLLDHVLGHYKNYSCEFCDVGFVNRSTMIEHKQKAHNIVQKIKCSRNV